MINLLGRKTKNGNGKKNNSKDIEIVFKGLEIGEKIDEIIHEGELQKTEHPRINISINKKTNLSDSNFRYLDDLINVISKSESEIKEYINKNFPNIIDIK